MSEDQREPFHVVEYRALREEMLLKITQIGQIYNFFFVSVFATVAWLMTYADRLDQPMLVVGAWVPFLVTHYFAAYRKDHSDAIHGLGRYLETLENRFAEPGLGWQRTVRVADGKPVKVYWRTRAIFLYVRIATLMFAIYFTATRVRFPGDLDIMAVLHRVPDF